MPTPAPAPVHVVRTVVDTARGLCAEATTLRIECDQTRHDAWRARTEADASRRPAEVRYGPTVGLARLRSLRLLAG